MYQNFYIFSGKPMETICLNLMLHDFLKTIVFNTLSDNKYKKNILKTLLMFYINCTNRKLKQTQLEALNCLPLLKFLHSLYIEHIKIYR